MMTIKISKILIAWKEDIPVDVLLNARDVATNSSMSVVSKKTSSISDFGFLINLPLLFTLLLFSGAVLILNGISYLIFCENPKKINKSTSTINK